MFPWDLFPFNEQMMKKLKKMQPEEIENYVQQMIKEMIPKERQQMQWMSGQGSDSVGENENQLKVSVFQTHEDVYVIIPIEHENSLNDLRIFHTASEFIIERDSDKQVVNLPAIVKRKGAKAIYKDGLLEVKIPRSLDVHISEIHIRNEQ